MTKAEEKLIVFTDLLNLVIKQIKIYLSHPNPEFKNLIHYFPRIISNTVFDNTSNQEYCIQKVHHVDGKYLRREDYKKRIRDLKKEIKYLRKELRQKSFKKHKGAYTEEIPIIQNTLISTENNLVNTKLEVSKIGQIDYMHEHVVGREQASKYILDYILQNDLTMDVGKTKEVLKRFCFTIQLEKQKKIHTQANIKLEGIQRGNVNFDNYEEIINSLGYQNLDPQLKPRFEAAKIDLKYFTK